MNLAKVSEFTWRTFSLVSFGLLALAGLEKICNVAGYTLVKGSVAPQRMLEDAAVLLLFVVALLLRDVREKLLSG
jgi:hypothetical protein